jgi:hypothetical protein
MPITYYDIADATPEEDGWVDIERIYCFDWDAFDKALMDQLEAVFKLLPEARRMDSDGCYWWYADDEDVEGGYLTAGVEPPGLQVFGTLQVREWEKWDSVFQEKAAGFPMRQID